MKKICVTVTLFLMMPTINYCNNPDPLELTIPARPAAGFFADLLSVLDNILHYEDEHPVKINVDWTDEFFPYKDNPHENGWDLYCEPIEIAPYDNQRPLRKISSMDWHHELHDQLCLDTWILYDKYLPYRLSVHETLKKIKFKRHILQKADNFYNASMAGNLCIGVHVRFGAAHACEVPGGPPSLDAYRAEIDALIEKNAGAQIKIFLATDSHFVINYFKNHYPTSMLLHIDAFRAQGSEEPHNLLYENEAYWRSHPSEWHKKKPGYFGGETTLLDGLLLSHCKYFIHTTSNLASFVVFMNPYIKSIYLPKNLSPRPCHMRNTPFAPTVKHQWHMYLS